MNRGRFFWLLVMLVIFAWLGGAALLLLSARLEKASLLPKQPERSNRSLVYLPTPTAFLLEEAKKSPTPLPTFRLGPISSPTLSPYESATVTDNWQVYTSNTYGFSIRYPAEAFIQMETFNQNEVLLEVDIIATVGRSRGTMVQLRVVDGDSRSKLGEIGVTVEENGEIKSANTRFRVESIRLGDVDAIKVTGLLQEGWHEDTASIFVPAKDGDKTVVITGWPYFIGRDFRDIFDKIVKTFQFIS